jgi:Icc-related predicted phosphoesterase
MIVTAVADLHGNLVEIPPCDLLLIAGDICPVRDHTLRGQRLFLEGPFRRWLDAVPARHVVGVAGNHDFIFQHEPERVPADLRWTYLQDEATTVGGLKVYGTPWQPVFFDWAFNLTEPELAKKWALIPDDADVLVFHGPPAGYGDLTVRGDRTGSPSQLDAIRRVKPRLVVFGHIHEGRGQWTLDLGQRSTTLANVSVVDERYRLVRPPATFELP